MNGCFRRAVLRFAPKRNSTVERADGAKPSTKPSLGFGRTELLSTVGGRFSAETLGRAALRWRMQSRRNCVGWVWRGLVSGQWKCSRRLEISVWEEEFWNKELIPMRAAKEGLADRKRVLLENGLERGTGSV